MKKDYAQYLLKKTTEDYNLIAEQFSSTRRFLWKDLEPLIKYAIPRDKVLDIGCGNGRLLQLFKDIDIDYTGVDSSEKLIEIARQHYPNKKFQLAEALKLPFPNNYFDKVYAIAVLHHIPSEELRLEFLREARRVLHSEGKMVLTVWNLWQWRGWGLNLKYVILKILGRSKLDFKDVFVPWGKSCQRYIHCFAKKELKDLVRKAGFKVKEMDGNHNLYIVAGK